MLANNFPSEENERSAVMHDVTKHSRTYSCSQLEERYVFICPYSAIAIRALSVELAAAYINPIPNEVTSDPVILSQTPFSAAPSIAIICLPHQATSNPLAFSKRRTEGFSLAITGYG